MLSFSRPEVDAITLLEEEPASSHEVAIGGTAGVAAAVMAVDDRYRGLFVERRVDEDALGRRVDPATDARNAATFSSKGASTSWA